VPFRGAGRRAVRKAGATIAAENGATVHQLMAIFGWDTPKKRGPHKGGGPKAPRRKFDTPDRRAQNRIAGFDGFAARLPELAHVELLMVERR
jgi:hypothetical protein